MAKGEIPCGNCGGEHYAQDFPHPCNKSKIKKAKEERVARRGGGGHNAGRNSGRSGGFNGRRKGGRKKWSNNNEDGDINDYGNGVKKRGSYWM